jgi:hypothetical protein
VKGTPSNPQQHAECVAGDKVSDIKDDHNLCVDRFVLALVTGASSNRIKNPPTGPGESKRVNLLPSNDSSGTE